MCAHSVCLLVDGCGVCLSRHNWTEFSSPQGPQLHSTIDNCKILLCGSLRPAFTTSLKAALSFNSPFHPLPKHMLITYPCVFLDYYPLSCGNSGLRSRPATHEIRLVDDGSIAESWRSRVGQLPRSRTPLGTSPSNSTPLG
jgi:hypothetical protein